MKSQKIKVTGVVRLVLRDALGKIIKDVTHKNAIVDAGLAYYASRAIGVTSPIMSHMAIGSSFTGVIPADTTLGTELGRVNLISSSASLNDNIYTAAFGPGVATGAITEAGIFNNVAAGTLLNRLVFSVINKGALDTLEVSWTVSFADDGV